MSKGNKVKVISRGPRKALLLIFGCVFAVIGAVLLWQTQAAPGSCSSTDVIGSATYTVSAPEAAQYRIWARIQVPEATNTNNINGIKLEIDSNQCFKVTTTSASAVNQWLWVNSDATASSTPHITSQISAGTHTIKILGMKAGVKVDKVLLLKQDNTCTPSNDFTNGEPGENCTTSAPVVTLNANPTSVVSGSSSSLTWSATDANSCTASGATNWNGAKNISGTQSTGALTTATTYTLTCNGVGGSGSRNVTVNVTQPPAPTLTLTANPTSVVSGNSSVLTWSATNASTCSAAWTSSTATSGSQSTGNLTSAQTYNMTCTGAGGSVSRSASVAVTAAPPTDTTPPNIVFTIPNVTVPVDSTPVLVRNQREITWQPLASDTVGVSSLVLTVNSQTVTLTGGAYKFGAAANGNGNYTLKAVATDTLGNTAEKTVVIQLRHPDFNRDGRVNIDDLSRLLRAWGTASTNLDLDIKNNVDLADLSYLMRNWYNP